MGRITVRFLVVLAAMLIAGCVRFEPRPIDPARFAADFDSRSLSAPGLKAFIEASLGHELAPWPAQTWTPDTLTLAAMYFSPDMDLARARWGIARTASKTAAELPNPTVSVAPGYNTTTVEPSPWIMGASIDLPIETAGKRGYQIGRASCRETV